MYQQTLVNALVMNFRVATSGQMDIGSKPVDETLHFSLQTNLPIEISKTYQADIKFNNFRKTSFCIFSKQKIKWNNNIKLSKGDRM